MSTDSKFTSHIESIVNNGRSMSSWILRTFKSREKVTMLTLWKALIIPRVEYCSVLWSPTNTGDIQALETLQWSFFRKITEFKNSNYWEILKMNNIYSLQRRRER